MGAPDDTDRSWADRPLAPADTAHYREGRPERPKRADYVDGIERQNWEKSREILKRLRELLDE